ncbi:MAG: hypothetical protein V4702_05660 [Patescibacteria group bacterium]
MNYPTQASELIRLLKDDQTEWREFAKVEFEADYKSSLNQQRAELRKRVHLRAQKTLRILDEIGEPTLSNIGADAAQAMSILALHDSLKSLRKVLSVFILCYEKNRDTAYFQAIPSMTDWLLVLGRKPQQFGTIWLLDSNKEPYLPIVKDFANVNERREQYGIGLLHWPKSLAISEKKQPWLKRPLSELIMRKPTDEEFREFAQYYL